MLNAETQTGSGGFSHFNSQTVGGQTFGSSPTQGASGPYQYGPQVPGFNSMPTVQGTPSSSGMVAPQFPTTQAGPYWGPTASGAFAGQPNVPPRKRWGRGKLVGVWGGALLAVLLVVSAGAFYVYTAFLANNPVQSARYLPGGTLVYVSVDLVGAAQGGSKLNQGDVNNTANTQAFEQATGLNFQTDVLPWLKRDFTYALVHVSQQANQFGERVPSFDTVFLISTKDTNASNAAIAKAVKNQEDTYGVKFKTITYNGVTLQSDVDSAQQNSADGSGVGPTLLVLGVVSDQVIVANSVTVAEQVIDRANNSTDRLADNSTFKDAISKLPSDRFATMYVNVHDLVRALLTPGDNGSSNLGTIDDYPVAYGYVQNTADGEKAAFTLQAKAGTHLKYAVNGDTTQSAGVVPDTAFAYGGLGNLGNFYHEVTDLGGSDAGADSSFQQEYGLSLDDPLFQAPLSFALLASPQSETPDVLVMLHVSGDPASADAKVQGAFQNAGYVTSTSTVSGVTVTEIKKVINLDNGTGNPNPGTVPPTVTQTQGYYAALGHDLVFASTLDAITQSIAASQGKVGSLAKLAAFQNAVKQGPKNMALSVFISLDNLANAQGPLGDAYRDFAKKDTSALSKIKTAYLIYSWDDSGITLTEVIAIK